ncbi:ABC transporter substrate-binding protein aliphatic sulfonates family SsuA [Zymomonas mobilis subsp. mobilis ZM4 = ATCC 31821]|uniref:Extracellular solute-binding protein family 3 n=1 Tax=Zymomonas mobilis subsp. mobilis (strain ATCC 31821 / ZM4 / CP4) TaxID=264203 RepID=Q5NN25_ZYMMO|nr:ABC transporter substrate-binding protein [Zymomonas mobilis]AAV89885.1 extracellular solute-binding protein family 3 [Zymomonas mobilis subsp. mobilis ZM4 = ATCC 31821]ART94216.1 ABC transporter substrate-binding protein [Zymomonas mobilis subsp. mobilis]AVZ26133.1 ABC transporter substrate-binding protein aliphatic sulfonates family SsuA [Zymomonas mobilis subsp. mobilis]AVZ28023.1 ABC transporter substrate-binding protein aliphatic sulfonates family SsuA [Zymomonas mobilis subsp. mobilis]
MKCNHKLVVSFALLGSFAFAFNGCNKNVRQSNNPNPFEERVLKEAKTNLDLSQITLRVGASEGRNGQSVIKAAKLDNTPYKVDFNVLQSGNLTMSALSAHQLDLGTGSQIPPLFASQAANGGNFKIIAIRKGATLDQELLIKKDSPIHSISQLKGKRVAYVKGTTAQYFLAKMLKNAGLSWQDIDAIPTSTSDGLFALLSGKVDAYASYGNAVLTAHQKGAKTLESAEKILSGDYYWYATPAAINDPKKHAAIVDYLARYHEANEWAREHPEEWSEIYSNENNQTPEDFLQILNQENKQSHARVAPIDEKTITSEKDIADTFHDLKLLNNRGDIHEIFDDSFKAEIGKFTPY